MPRNSMATDQNLVSSLKNSVTAVTATRISHWFQWNCQCATCLEACETCTASNSTSGKSSEQQMWPLFIRSMELNFKFLYLKHEELLWESTKFLHREQLFHSSCNYSQEWGNHTVPHWYWQHLLWPAWRQGHLCWWCTDEETALSLTCRQPVHRKQSRVNKQYSMLHVEGIVVKTPQISKDL